MRNFLILSILLFACRLSLAGIEPSVFIESGKEGLKDQYGNVLIPAKYEKVGWSDGHVIIVDKTIGYRENGIWGLISIDNKVRTKPIYLALYPAYAEFIIAKKSDPSLRMTPSGVIDSHGKVSIPFLFSNVEAAGSMVIVQHYREGSIRYGVKSLENNTVLPGHFSGIKYLNENLLAVMDDSGKWALFNDNGKPLSSFQFNSIGVFRNGVAPAEQNRLKGLIGVDGHWKVEPLYSEVTIINPSEATVVPLATWDIITETNEKIHSVEFDSVLPWEEAKWKVKANGFEWIVNEDFHAITPDSYNRIKRLNADLITFEDHRKFGVMYDDGKFLINAEFDSIYTRNDRIYTQSETGTLRGWSLFNFQGQRLTPFGYQNIRPEQSNELIPVRRNMFWGFIDKTGTEVIPCTFDSIGMAIPGKVVVKFRGKEGVINLTGNWVQTPVKGKLTLIDDRYYLQKVEKVTYLKQYNGGTIYFTENEVEIKDGFLIETLKNNSFWKITFSGQIQNTSNLQEYEEIRLMHEDFIAVRIAGRYGFIDSQDRLRIANRYDKVHDFHEGLAGFKLIGKWGFIDKQERIVIQPLFDEVGDFNQGLCIVGRNNKRGVVDKKGNEVIAMIYDDVKLLENGRYLIVKDGKKGLLDKEGRIIVNPKYDDLQDLDAGHVIVKKHNKFGLISRRGDDLIPFHYDYLLYDPFNNYYLGMKKVEPKTIPLR